MSIINFLFGRKPKSSSVARDRLQIIVSQERGKNKVPDYLPALEKELLELLSKYVVKISKNDIKIKHEKKEGVAILELNISLPEDEAIEQKKILKTKKVKRIIK